MAIADKLLDLNDVKQGIKTAIEGKGVSMTGVLFTGYPAKIDSITTGTGMSYHDYAKMLYSMWGYGDLFTAAWTESQNSLEVLFEIPLSLAAANMDFGALIGEEPGETLLDIYVGTNSALTDFYNLVDGGGFGTTFPNTRSIIINKSVVRFNSIVGLPFPVYTFGMPEDSPATIDQFMLADLTSLGMGLGISLAKAAGTVIPDNSITVRRGLENYDGGLIIPEMIEIVGDEAFRNFSSDLILPYIIGHNVKYIGTRAFEPDLNSQFNMPLNIPDSVEWIGAYAFQGYIYNKNPLVIPRNVTYIAAGAFENYGFSGSNQPTVIMYPDIPPVIGFESELGAFPDNTYEIFVPDNAVNAYKSVWSEYAEKIKAISSRFQ